MKTSSSCVCSQAQKLQRLENLTGSLLDQNQTIDDDTDIEDDAQKY